MNKLLLTIFTSLITAFGFGQSNYFWVEGGFKYPKFERKVINSFNSFGQQIPSPLTIPSNRAFIISYGYGRMLNRNFAIETGVRYNHYKFSYTYFGYPHGLIYSDFYSMELPLRVCYNYKIRKLNTEIQLSIGQTFNFIGFKSVNYSVGPIYSGFITKQDSVFDNEFSSVFRSFFTLTEFGFGVKKPIGNRFSVGISGRYNLGYKPIFVSDVTYRINDNGQGGIGNDPRYGNVQITSKGTYYSICLNTSYRF